MVNRGHQMESVKIQDHMDHRPVFFKKTENIVEAVEKLLQSKRTGGPVVNDDKQVIGFISEQDCIKAMLSTSYHSGEEASLVVAEVMRTEVLTKKPYESVLQVAEDMSNNKPKVYPVVDDDNILVGLINRTDIIRALDVHFHSIYEQGQRFV